MAIHLIVGAGAVGSATAHHLVELGHRVRIVTRSGSGPELDGVERIAADATDTTRHVELATGVHAVYNCANPRYDRWATDWPPVATSLLDVAETTGARLVTMSNLYGYAVGASPMAATDPLDPPTKKGAIRVHIWEDALARHAAGRVRVTEARASDFFGPGLGDTAHLGDRFVRAALRGRTPRVVGAPDVEHSWTYVDDVGRTLATLGTDDRSLGRAWHVPTAPALTAQEMADALTDAAGLDRVGVQRIPGAVRKVAGWFSPEIRELREMLYQFEQPFVIDAAETTSVFGLRWTPFAEQLRATIAGTPRPRVSTGV